MYPKNRKKKIPHHQHFAFHRAMEFGYPVDVYYMLYDKRWWACLKGDFGYAKLTYEGETFTKVCPVKAFLGAQGERIVGYYRVVYKSNKSPRLVNFAFISQDFCAGVILHGEIKKHYKKLRGGWYNGGRPKVPPMMLGAYQNKKEEKRGFLTKMAQAPKKRILRKPKHKAI